jgi:hypothetical protein
MPNGSWSLGEAAQRRRTMLRLACLACGRQGQYRLDQDRHVADGKIEAGFSPRSTAGAPAG